MTITVCHNEPCDQPGGHDGPHGIVLQPGLILAPHENYGGIPCDEPTSVPCHFTGHTAPLRLTRRFPDGGGELSCSQCDQRVTLGPRGYSSIATTLYGERQPEKEVIRGRLDDFRWWTLAEAAVGLTGDMATYTAHQAEWEAEAARILMTPEPRPWWRFW